MKCLSIVAGLVALGGLSMSGLASAGCPGQPTAATVLSGRTTCVTKPNGDRYQEFHAASGELIDYKRGPGHATDPSKKVGTWSASGNDVVYNYGPGQQYRYTVHRAGNSNNFCLKGSGEEIRPSAVLQGQAACP